MEKHKEIPVWAFSDVTQWLSWLSENHDSSGSIWLKFAKKGTGIASVTYEEARDAALTYGWIDGLRNKYDAQFFLVRFSPRNPKSAWSKVNREIVDGLIEAGKMQPSGMAQVEAAKRDGRWEAAYDSQSKMGVPDDFAARLEAHPLAKAAFEALNSANRYAFLYRIQTARTPETRARQIQKAIEMLSENKVHYPKLKSAQDETTESGS